MIKRIALYILEKGDRPSIRNTKNIFLENGISDVDIRTEFDVSVDEIIDLAHTLDPPNKISMIVEFERIKSLIKRVPTKQDIDANSDLLASQYESEFESWGHLLDRLEYDPWYRSDTKSHPPKRQKIDRESSTRLESDCDFAQQSLEEIRSAIRNELKNEPDTLRLFDILDQNIAECDELELESMMGDLD